MTLITQSLSRDSPTCCSNDETAKTVERESDRLIVIGDFIKTYGEPLKKIKTLYDFALGYINFAADVVDGEIKKMVYFKRETV